LILALFVVLIRLLDAAWLWFWVISIAALPSDFLLRMSYARAPGISLLMMLAIIWACIRVRPVVLAVLAFCYCHIYLGGVMYTPLIVGAFIASYAVCGQERDVRACVKLAAGAVVGISLAVVTNPFRGDVLQFLYTQVFESGLQTTQNRVSVGNEWKPYDLYDWARMSCYVLVVFATTVVFRSTWNRIMDPRILALLIINVGFLGLCMRARRFIEYWPALCLLSSAALWAGFDRTLASLRGRLAAAPEAASLVGRVGLAACVGAGAVGLFTAANARDVATCRFDIPQIKTAMAYLAEVSKPGDVVFADDWDVFPMFFYYNHHNYYVCGLDPQFVNSIDPELWERYAVITQGRAPKTSRVYVAGAGGAEEVKEFEVTIDDVREKFDATWVIVDSDHAGFYRQMRDRPDLFTQVFPPPKPADRKPPPLSIFRVTPQDQ
jgi:hypothetical protein